MQKWMVYAIPQIKDSWYIPEVPGSMLQNWNWKVPLPHLPYELLVREFLLHFKELYNEYA
jgi:hypothetical protein